MDVAAGEDGINLRLRAKKGVQIDASEIGKCLDYTVGKVSGQGGTDS